MEPGTDYNETTGEIYDPGADEGELVVQPELTPMSAAAKGEVEMQLEAAHRYPRSVKKFLADATTLATLDVETAEACIYSYKRGGKNITGPSIRCAEIVISCWGNSHVGARVVAIEDKDIVAQGGAWDLEKNVKCTMETRRRITGKDGSRFSDDMIAITGNAAASIALRNAIFKIVPLAYVNRVYDAARKVAVGNASSLSDRRAKVLTGLAKMGATIDRVLAAMGKPSVDDIGSDDVATLIGLGTALKDGSQKLDDVFPDPARHAVPAPVPAEEQGKRMSLRKPAAEPAPATPEPGSNG